MSTRSCAFVVWSKRLDLGRLVATRARALERFYDPAGLTGMVVTPILGGRAYVGAIGTREEPSSMVSWGAPFGGVGRRPRDVLGSDESLRRHLVGVGAAVAWNEELGRVVNAPSGPNALYRAQAEDIRVWATHAVAAGYLASGNAELDPAAIPELVAYDFVGTTRTLVRGVVPQAPATRIDLTADSVREACYWPPAERWAAIPEEEAHEHTAAHLLETLDARIGSRRSGLALTAGADSRVLAVALDELGRETEAFSWGEAEWPDVEGARMVAEALDMPFSHGATWRSDAELRRALDAESRWTDGGTALSLSERRWPPAVGAIVLGAAGEVGRAFYYRRGASGTEPSDREGLAAFLSADSRLRGAEPAARAIADSSVSAWLDRAVESGLDGWRLLDVVYADQRVGCWGRIQLPSLTCDIVAGFAPQQVIRGLTCLPVAERVSDGFHRRFVAERRPALALREPRSHVPSSHPARWRQGLRRFRRRLRSKPPANTDPLLVQVWSGRPETREWVADEVLDSRLIRGALGDEWTAATRAGFLAGRRRAVEQAGVAAAPVTLAAALRELA